MSTKIVDQVLPVTPIETITIREGVYKTPHMRVDTDEVRWPDGRLGEYAKVINGSGLGAIVIPMAMVGGVAYIGMVRQFRYPLAKETLEFPRGGVADDGQPESHPAGAARELKEELGSTPVKLLQLGGIHGDSAILSDYLSAWLAIMEPVAIEKQHHEEDTGLRSMWVTEDELVSMMIRGEINCGPSLAAYALLQVRRPQMGSWLTAP